MNLRQLEYFVAIADEGSFTRAAERLLVAQPSLSQQMKSLERELGGQLLERLPNGVRLTAAGKAFMPDARLAVTHAAHAARSARGALGLEAGELEVATVTSVAFGILPPAFELWHTRYPATTIVLREYQHRRALDDAVRAGAGDVAVGPRPAQWTGPVVDLGWEEFVAVLPRSDPLARRRRTVALEDLADRDWVLFGPDHGLTELVLEVCARAGFVPRQTVETGQVAAATNLAAAGFGVTLVPSNVVPHELKANVRRLQSPVARELVAFARQDWTPLTQAFLDVLQGQAWPGRPRSATVAT
jgi:DNA-binding transcriptional LysR family regulator